MENKVIVQTINLEEKIQRLEAEKAALEEENKELRKKKKHQEEFKGKFTWWIAKIISILGAMYLLLAILSPSNLKINKIGNAEVLVFVVLLLFNSGILEKLEDFSVDGTKVQAKFQRLEANQEKQKNELYELQKQQLNLQQQQLETLTNQQQEIASLQQKHKFALNFVSKSVVDYYEFRHLKKLEESEKKQTPYIFSAKFVNPLQRELRHLYAVGFIEKYQSISSLVNILEQDRNRQVDLTQYIHITPEGKEYLKLRRELGIAEDLQTDDEDAQQEKEYT